MKLACFLWAVLSIGLAYDAQAQITPLQRLSEYIAVDTTNPPGNERRGVEFFSKIFDEAGVPYETAESAPGRGNIWARLEGGGEPALVLLHHMDVVPATPEFWDTDPLQAVVKDGMLYGRGALDTKSLGIIHLEAFLALHRNARPLNRDVIFMATADEEAGGLYGAGWLVENRPELFNGVGFLLNEGGRGVKDGEQLAMQIEVAQKRPFWLRLVATDDPGHGSRPLPTSAPTRLIAALHRIEMAPFEPRVVGPVREMFRQLAPYADPQWRDSLSDIDRAITDTAFLGRFHDAEPGLHALLRNTCSITVLSGSEKINVVPPSANAEVDCRILPDQNSEEFLQAIRDRVADEQIKIEQILLFSPAQSSTDTSLYQLLGEALRRHYPSAGVVASVSTGFTDSHFFRDLGITSYGFSPTFNTLEVGATTHGNNERISVETFKRGVGIMTEILQEFVER